MNSSRCASALLAVLIAGCASQMPTQVKGTASYLERMALPPGAVFEATLEDVSKADAKAEVIASTCIERPGNPPIVFAIPYDPSRIDPKRRYAVRARITLDGRPLFITDQHYPAFGRSTSEVTLALRIGNIAPETPDVEIGDLVRKYAPDLECTGIRRVDADGSRPAAVLEFAALPMGALERVSLRLHGMYWKNRALFIQTVIR